VTDGIAEPAFTGRIEWVVYPQSDHCQVKSILLTKKQDIAIRPQGCPCPEA